MWCSSKIEIRSKVYPRDDAKVRKVDVKYKNPRTGELDDKYQGRAKSPYRELCRD